MLTAEQLDSVAATPKAALANIEKQFGKGSVMRLGDDTRAPLSVIPTGAISLDIALGLGGLPRGRVVEIYGPESSGKTTVALHAVANAQAAGGIVAIVGANGAGKTTTMQMLCGILTPTRGVALFINAYNACTLALVVDRLPADASTWATWSIKDAGSTFTSVWRSYRFEVAGKRYTLDEMEHAVLRPLGDPRIHMAINCASRSCPPLIAEPFRLATLDAQLEAAARAFAASPHHLRLDEGVLRINPILDWFGADFAAGGGVRAGSSRGSSRVARNV